MFNRSFVNIKWGDIIESLGKWFWKSLFSISTWLMVSWKFPPENWPLWKFPHWENYPPRNPLSTYKSYKWKEKQKIQNFLHCWLYGNNFQFLMTMVAILINWLIFFIYGGQFGGADFHRGWFSWGNFLAGNFQGRIFRGEKFHRGNFHRSQYFYCSLWKTKIVSFASSTMKTLLYVKIFFLVCSVFIIQ